jgi:hypothetical protein
MSCDQASAQRFGCQGTGWPQTMPPSRSYLRSAGRRWMALVWRLFQQPPRVGPWGLAASKSWFQAGESFASIPPNACHHQAAGVCRHRGYLGVAALVNGIVSGHLCGLASTLGGVRDEQVQRQLFHFHPVDTQAQRESP